MLRSTAACSAAASTSGAAGRSSLRLHLAFLGSRFWTKNALALDLAGNTCILHEDQASRLTEFKVETKPPVRTTPGATTDAVRCAQVPGRVGMRRHVCEPVQIADSGEPRCCLQLIPAPLLRMSEQPEILHAGMPFGAAR